MSGILKKFSYLMSANIPKLLEKEKNPGKKIDKYLKQLNEDLARVKIETGPVLAEEKRLKDQLADCIRKRQQAEAEMAEESVLEHRREREAHARQMYELAALHGAQMKQLHDKLVQDIDGLEVSRRKLEKYVSVAKTAGQLDRKQDGQGLREKAEEKIKKKEGWPF